MYLNSHTNNISTTDSSTLVYLANLCPMKDGAVVYQARTMLRMITHYIEVYDDNCFDGGGDGQKRTMAGTIEQNYQVSPNPNDGNVWLWQALKDKEPVSIKVYNTIGALIYTDSKRFEGNTVALNLSSVAPGMYTIVLHDSYGTSYSLRFVKK